jgi:hypothetical protein
MRKATPIDPDNPSFAWAMSSDSRAEWVEACLSEIGSLAELGTFELVPRPVGSPVISGKWVLKIKRGPSGEIERYKARYVARGFTQVEGVDFFDTWAPVGSYATLRVLFSVAAVEDLEMRHIDIQCAFLNGVIEGDVYVEQPEMFGDGSDNVWKLRKTLYGLKQSAREWHKELAKLLAKMGFRRSDSDPGLYIRKQGRCFIFLWVDDLFVFSKSEGLQELINEVLSVFKGRDLGNLTWALGAEILRDRPNKTITLSQNRKILNMLDKFGMSDCKSSPTPLVPREQLRSVKDHPECAASKAEHSQFMSAVGSIQYLVCVTRPDLAYACNALARHMGGSMSEHWKAVQRVLRYLKGTVNVGIEFRGAQGSSEAALEAYSDADFANEKGLKSVSGMLVRVYGNAVHWRSKRQPVIAGDTTEAELIAMSATANELMALKKLMVDLELPVVKPTLWGDNKSANILANDPIASDRSKHIRVKHLRVREFVERDEIKVEWVGTTEQLADGFTKTLPGPALVQLRESLHLVPTG